jgi:ABC-type uncharacterized transport system substrate-binding protein
MAVPNKHSEESLMATQIILAIAIGDPMKSRIIGAGTSLTGIRPYIVGLINYLSQQVVPTSKPQRKYAIGTDYIIDYQECWEDHESFPGKPNIIFCMSTPVTRKARDFTSTIPIVGVFSEATVEKFDQTSNVCGLNAKRIQIARKYYDNFLSMVTGLTSVSVLHRVGNTASNKALAAIQAAQLPIPLSVLSVTPAPGNDIGTLIAGIAAGSGLLVLPVDLFFGAADFINAAAAAKSVPVFWPVPDWVPPGIGGHGASQERCGELMGQQVQYVLEHPGHIPQGPARFLTVKPSDIKSVGSEAAAKALNIKLGKHGGLTLV